MRRQWGDAPFKKYKMLPDSARARERLSSIMFSLQQRREEKICVICHEVMVTNPTGTTLCKNADRRKRHEFHTQCLFRWYEVDNRCPCCKTEDVAHRKKCKICDEELELVDSHQHAGIFTYAGCQHKFHLTCVWVPEHSHFLSRCPLCHLNLEHVRSIAAHQPVTQKIKRLYLMMEDIKQSTPSLAMNTMLASIHPLGPLYGRLRVTVWPYLSQPLTRVALFVIFMAGFFSPFGVWVLLRFLS